MWKASAGHQLIAPQDDADDDWETDTDFVNDVTEQEQRWGSKTVEGSGRTAGAINMQQLRQETEQADANKKKKQIEESNPGFGYGGKFGVETDRMDKSAMGHDYIGKVEKHESQTDYSRGFGGKYGVQTDRVDKSAAGWDHKELVTKHSSQKDYATGFGGKFGVQSDRVDKSAVGWDHIEKVEKHESQKDYSHGFGGKFGVQDDRKDSSAVGWDYVEAPQKHESQLDHKVGFGGKFGVQSDRMDKSAVGFQENPEKVGTNYLKTKPDIGSAKPSNLRAKFENLAKSTEEEDLRRTAEQKKLREEKDRVDHEVAAKRALVENNPRPSDNQSTQQRKGNIETGRSGSINTAISAFNQVQSPTESTAQRKEPIKLPKETTKTAAPSVVPAAVPTSSVPPDVIPQSKPIPEFVQEKLQPRLSHNQAASPVALTTNRTVDNQSNGGTAQDECQPTEQLYANVSTELMTNKVDGTNDEVYAAVESNDPIYQNQDDLLELIEDTGVRAIALYDYQAAADDEISFDPDDIITHIEQIDEGWWRGLCRNHYGLFPANYVQLQQ